MTTLGLIAFAKNYKLRSTNSCFQQSESYLLTTIPTRFRMSILCKFYFFRNIVLFEFPNLLKFDFQALNSFITKIFLLRIYRSKSVIVLEVYELFSFNFFAEKIASSQSFFAALYCRQLLLFWDFFINNLITSHLDNSFLIQLIPFAFRLFPFSPHHPLYSTIQKVGFRNGRKGEENVSIRNSFLIICKNRPFRKI